MFLQNTKLYVTTAKKLSTSLNNGGYGLLSKVYSSSSTDANVQQLITTTIQNSDMNKPTIGRTRSEQEFLCLQQPEMPENPKLLKVSVLGVPNSGKSTLVNRIMNRRISSVSSRMNTTRNRLTAVLTDKDSQLIFLDTPGLLPFRKQKKFNLDRQFIIDPHSSLWESDLVCVVHDVSDEYSRNRIDKEILKCLFTHPEKETLLILNKTDKLKNKKILLDMVVDLTGGLLNGKEFINKKKSKHKYLSRTAFRDYDYEKMFIKTAEKMNINLEANTKTHSQIIQLLDELKTCEEYLLKNLDKINVNDEVTDENKPAISDLSSALLDEKNRMSLEKLQGLDENAKTMPTNMPESSELGVISSIVASSPAPDTPPLRRIEDISPIEFKKDLLQTTDWHLYYKKLNSLSLLVRDKTYWPYFSQVFMVSSLMNDGVDDLKRYLFSRAKPANWIFSRNMLTDQMPQEIAEMCVREKMLEVLPDEIPYEIGLETLYWDIDDSDRLNIVINLKLGTSSKSSASRQAYFLYKDGGKNIKQIKESARQEMMNTFQSEVNLRLLIPKKEK